jgi:uncharacterized protein (DUF1697 family)
MARYVALLRGINVGKNKRLAMADLRELLAGLGYTDVATHLNSGNAVFTYRATKPEKLAVQIEKAITEMARMSVRCLVRSSDELRAVIDAHPLEAKATDGSKMMALFLSEAPDATLLAEYDPISLDPDNVRMGDRVIYQWCQNGILESPQVGGFVEKNLKVTVTRRNWNTVTKLSDLLDR